MCPAVEHVAFARVVAMLLASINPGSDHKFDKTTRYKKDTILLTFGSTYDRMYGCTRTTKNIAYVVSSFVTEQATYVAQ